MTPAEIAATRKRLGLTQARLAVLLPVPKRTIENWEAGRRNPPEYLPRAFRDRERELEREWAASSEFGQQRDDHLG